MPPPTNFRWLFTDPADLSTYRFDLNPSQMSTPYPVKQQDQLADIFGKMRVLQSPIGPAEFKFAGKIRTQGMYDALLLWSQKDHEIQLTDHLGRNWMLLFTSFEPVDRRSGNRANFWTYQMSALLLSEA